MRVYLSGPMTGIPDFNVAAFREAAAKLREHGHDVLSPPEICEHLSGDWHECMRADIKALCDADAIALLPGWTESKGAHLELHIAHRLGLRIGTVDEFAR